MQEDYAPRRQNRLFMQEIRRNGDADFLTAVRRNQQPNLPQERRRQRRRRRIAQGDGDVDEQLLQRGLAHQQAHGALELGQGAQQRLAFLKLLGGRGFRAHRRLRMVKAQGNAPDAQENPEAVEAFLKSYAESVEYVNANVEEAAQLVGKYEIVPAAVAQKAIPACNIVCITGADMQQKLSGYLNVLFEQNPKAVGGALPADDFYYNAK